MRTRDEPRFECGWREKHAARECRPMPTGKQRGVGVLRIGVIPNRTSDEITAPHGSRMICSQRNAVPARGFPQSREQAGGASLELVVKAGSLGLLQCG